MFRRRPAAAVDLELIKNLSARIQQPVRFGQRIVGIGPKGGSAKTTNSALVAKLLAEQRREYVALMDGNPDLGTVAMRLGLGLPRRTLVDLAATNPDRIVTLADVEPFLQADGLLHVASNDGVDPARIAAMTSADHTAAAAALGRFHPIVVTDSGTSVVGPASQAALSNATQLVISVVLNAAAMNLAAEAVDYLSRHGYEDLISRATVVVNVTDSDLVVESFRAGLEWWTRPAANGGMGCKALVVIPYDGHLHRDGRLSMQYLAPPTQIAYLLAAAAVVDGMASA